MNVKEQQAELRNLNAERRRLRRELGQAHGTIRAAVERPVRASDATVTLTRNAKGDVQITVEAHHAIVGEAAADAKETFDLLCAAYPFLTGGQA